MLAPFENGCRLVRATGAPTYDDDPTLPFKITLSLCPPSFMRVAFIAMHGGGEEFVVRGESKAAIAALLRRSDDLHVHPRLRRVEINGPDGVKVFDRGADLMAYLDAA